MRTELPHDLLERVQLAAVHAYLVRNGWERRPVERDIVVQFLSPDEGDESFPLLVPNSRDVVDYVQAIGRTLRILAEYEERPVTDLLEQVVTPQPEDLT